MKKLGKFSYVLAAVSEGAGWIGVAFVAMILLSLVTLTGYIIPQVAGGVIELGGETFTLGELKQLRNFALCAFPFLMAVCICTTLIFRNLRLILRGLRAENGEGFSAENSPFSEDVVRRVRRIGWLAVGAAASSTMVSFIGWLAFPDKTPFALRLSDIVFAVVVFYLSKIFEYGGHLQKETEGLV